jgi:hypothetical protein
MQFAGSKGIALFVALVAIACGVGFGAGLLVGRHFPAHSYQKFGDTRFLLNTASGQLCDPFKDPNEDPYAKYAVKAKADSSEAQTTQPDPYAAYGGHAVNSDGSPLSDIWKAPYPPPCGK